MQKVNINSLILDFDLYPRCKVDSQHAGYMLDSIEAGVELPPVIIDKKSKRVIDGFHRVTAWQRFFKLNKEEIPTINVILKSYTSEANMFLDAMKYNASHGRMLTQYDRAHCIIKAEALELSIDVTSGALSITVDKYGELRAEHTGELHVSPHLSKKGNKTTRKTAHHKTKLIPLKRTIKHLAGKELTVQQVEVNKKLSGMNQSFYVNQLIDLIESDLLDRENTNLMARLEKLYDLLKETVSKEMV